MPQCLQSVSFRLVVITTILQLVCVSASIESEQNVLEQSNENKLSIRRILPNHVRPASNVSKQNGDKLRQTASLYTTRDIGKGLELSYLTVGSEVSYFKIVRSQRSLDFCGYTLTTLSNISEYYIINNTTLHYIPLNVNLSVLNYTDELLPVVCLSSTSPNTISLFDSAFTQLSPGLLEFYYSLAIIVVVLSMASCLVAIVVFIYLKTMFGFVAMNIAIAFMLSDAVIILDVFLHNSEVLCVLLSITEHFFALAQFVWLAVLGIDFALRFYRVANCRRHQTHPRIVILYLSFGWGIPVLWTVFTVAINFVTDSQAVGHGLNGHCHINNLPSVLVLFSFPLIIGWTVCLVAVVTILIYLYKLPFNFDNCDRKWFQLISVFMFMMAIIHFIWIWVLLDHSALSHVISLFVFRTTVLLRSVFTITVRVVTNRKLFSAARTLCCTRNRVNVAIHEEQPDIHPVYRSRIAAKYPEEAEKLAKMMSEPTLVPKIHRCVQWQASKHYYFYGTGIVEGPLEQLQNTHNVIT